MMNYGRFTTTITIAVIQTCILIFHVDQIRHKRGEIAFLRITLLQNTTGAVNFTASSALPYCTSNSILLREFQIFDKMVNNSNKCQAY